MIKIKAKYAILVLGAIMLMAMSAVASATLRISDVDFIVNGKTESGTPDVKPGDEVKVKVEVENDYPESSNIEIEDIEVEVTIEDIDDGDDLDEEDEIDDLDPGDDDSVTIEFSIPEDADVDEYDVKIKVDGKANGTTVTDSEDREIEVEREQHEITIVEASVTNPKLKCSRQTSLDAYLKNTGASTENVIFKIESSGLNILKTESFTLDDSGSDDDNEYRNAFPLTVSSNVPAGVYPLFVRASYSSKFSEKKLDITVEDCQTAATAAAAVQPAVSAASQVTAAATAVTEVPVTVDEGADSTLILMAAGAVVLVLVILGLGYASFRKKPGMQL